MAIILLLCLFNIPSVSKSDNSILKESKSQASFYIHQIEKGRNRYENLWALTLIGSVNPKVRSYIENEAHKNIYTEWDKKPFEKFESTYLEQLKKVVFSTGSPELLVALLLSTKAKKKQREIYKHFESLFHRTKYSALLNTIIERKKITKKVLPNNRFSLPIFFLVFDSDYKKFISKAYLREIADQWKRKDTSHHNFNNALSKISYFRVLYLLDRYSETESLYNDLTNVSIFPNSKIKLRIYRYLDYSMYRLGYYDRSLEIVRNFTLPLAQKYGSELLLLSIKISKGTYLYNIGKVKEAQSTFESVISEAKNHNINLPETIVYNNLALAYYKTGHYNKYLDLQFQALEKAKKVDNYSDQLEIYNNLFIYYKRNNDEQNALDYLKQAQKLALKHKRPKDLGNIYISLGSFFRKFKRDYDKASEYFQKAESVLNPKNNVLHFTFLLNEEANTFEKQKSYLKALRKYDKIISINPPKSANHIDALINKALVQIKLGNIVKSGDLIEEFKSYNLNQLDFVQIVKAKTVEAHYLDKINHDQKALSILNPTIDQVVVRAKGSANLKTGFWHVEDEYLDAFELAVSINIDIGNADRAVELLDQLKTINDASLYQNPLVKASLLNESELTQYKKLTHQLDATRKKLLTAPKDKQFDIRQTISQLNLKKRKLDEKLTNNLDKNPVSVRQIQNRLSAHDMVIHMTELKDKYYIANISRSDVGIHTVSLNKQLRNLLTNSIRQVSTHKTNLDSLYAITKLLGLHKIPDRIHKITIIPDSYFYQLPIDILPLDKPDHSYSYGEVKYVIEKFRTQYLTSLDDFQTTNKYQPKSNKLSFAGYGISKFNGSKNKSLVPLPYAQREVKSIAQKLTHLTNVRTFINDASTKKTFTHTAPDAQIIHLATHSQVSERDPMFSTIYMSDAGNHADSTFDDQIFAYELFDLNLNNEMIMLNSCESGSGTYIQGTGVMGISRALQYAGANSLILNLWSVNDMMASDFAIHFYDQLNQGKSKTEALQNTKRYFLRTKNASPHYWGPYMLIGNSEPIVKPNEDQNMVMAGAFIGYFLLMVGLSLLADHGIIFDTENKKAA